MVTPENGTINLKGDSGQSYTISFYSSDVIGANVTFNLNGLAVAGSQTWFAVPENCSIVDLAVVTGQTVSTGAVIQINDANTGNVISWAQQLVTIATRPTMNIRLPKGAKFTMVQV